MTSIYIVAAVVEAMKAPRYLDEAKKYMDLVCKEVRMANHPTVKKKKPK